MFLFQSNTRSFGSSEASIKSGDFRSATSEIANSVDLLFIFQKYKIDINEVDRQIICPFSFHNDKTASFVFYKKTNSFHCFGCKSSGGPVQLVSLMDNISKDEAIKKLLSEFDVDTNLLPTTKDYIERQKLCLDFSAAIRAFLHKNIQDDNALIYAEKLTFYFDTLIKRPFDINGLKLIINTLKGKLKDYH